MAKTLGVLRVRQYALSRPPTILSGRKVRCVVWPSKVDYLYVLLLHCSLQLFFHVIRLRNRTHVRIICEQMENMQ